MYARHRSAQPRGRSVLKNSGVYTIVDTPTSDQCDAADIFYLGGHIYEVSEDEATALTTAGFIVTYGIPAPLQTESGDYLYTETDETIITEYVNA